MVDRADMDYIKKMAKDVCRLDKNCDECNMAYECKAIDYATRFYDARYRKTEWISVEERLPESRKFVIVCDEYGNVGEAYFYKQDRKFEWVDDEERVFATHWMPLPMPPKGDAGK